MQPTWLAPTTQGYMVGDYISTSFLAGQQRVIGAIAVGRPPAGGALNEPMFAALEKVRGGGLATSSGRTVPAGSGAPAPATTF
jgi:hypothetical protein